MVGGEAARGEEPGKCVRPDGPSSSQAEGGLDEVGRDGPGMAAPSHASVSGVELKDRTQGARAHIGEGDWQGPGHEQAGRGQGPAGSTSQPPWRPRARPIGSGHGKSAGPRDGPRSPGRSARNGTARRARLAHSGRAARCRPRSTGREGQGRRVRAVSELNLPGFAVRQAPRITGPSQRHDLHGDFHPIPSVLWPFPETGERGGLVLLTSYCHGDMLGADEFVVGGIETSPARAGI